MAKRQFLHTVRRERHGELFVFHVYQDAWMIHVVGNGDTASTGKPASGDPGAVIVNSLITDLFNAGNVAPGEHPA